MSEIRTRIAPSPTGDLHIGHLRTVLYNVAFTRKNNGKFLVRIEDTDRDRFVEGAMDRTLDVINSYGLNWDEGPRVGGDYGPYIQSERLSIYHKYVEELIEQDQAYRCFCTKEDLTKMREEQQKSGAAKTMYDGRCRKLSKDEVEKKIEAKEKYVVRQKVPRNQNITFDDVVYGEITFNSNEVDDTVLLKSDGFPTYHLAVVVDDHLMEITHVMRGNDWLPSTPKHVLMYKAFKWELPTYIHLPNLKEKGENRKLSKRYGAVFAIDFLKEGYLVEAVLNFLMLLGWNPGTEKEIYSLEEFIEDFDLSRIHKTDLVAFDREKLLWTNGYYIRSMSLEKLYSRLQIWSAEFDVSLHHEGYSEEFHLKVLAQLQDRLRYFGEYVRLSHYYFKNPLVEKSLVLKHAKSEEFLEEILNGYLELYENCTDWTAKNLEKISYDYIKSNEFKPKQAFMTLRTVLTGEEATPPIFDIMELLGKEIVLERLKKIK